MLLLLSGGCIRSLRTILSLESSELGHLSRESTRPVSKCRKDFEDDELYSLMQMLKKQTITMQRSVSQKNRTIDVASRDVTHFSAARKITKNDPPPGAHVFLPTGTIFELIQDIIGTNLLNKFHDDRTINVSSRVLTTFYDSLWGKNALSPGSHFHENETINAVSRELTRITDTATRRPLLTKKNHRPLAAIFFQATGTTCKLVQYIKGTLNVDSRVLRSVYYSHTWKNAPPPGGHVFKPTRTIFKLVQNTHLLTKCHEDANQFQDIAPDTKVPDGRTERRTDGKTDGRMDGQRQNNIPPPMAGDNNSLRKEATKKELPELI
ncbi:hypothetical protein DPMN_091914 [Dreissena polymorpha]|uniref:Uncharacterized protein n=1 Tax=Dreissena polymorpha TaxID=45954 RepID=A0A9D4QZI8_DREPO|nr:hypothetical protein DPMN_091914 [Dreissena polymorpha]